ncbi:MAG: aldehyde ferredoxin oxidoreductase family protein [Candidatus Brockarchaeota archaeon]|nr:aldehyde ferredoxin oxidoreductase family protein [Candidatus Brockarchaeota archaeon]
MTLDKILYIDLSKRRFHVRSRPDLFEKHIGGAGVAIRLLLEECPEKADPFGPENPIIFAVGPLTGLFPMASKTVAMFKSPLTGNLGESHAGGRSATAIRMAGYGAMVVKGASETPVYLAIYGSEVHFRDASGIWGIESSYTVGRIVRELESEAGLRTIMRIGRAGEKMVSYASVIVETYRHFGRLGLGAVFGSKKLKAIMICGKHSVKVENPQEYRILYDKIFQLTVKSQLMKKYHDIGTSSNVIPLNELKALPSINLRQTSLKNAENISGENLAEKHLGRRVSCSHCPVACIHLATLREPYEDEPYFYKTTMVPYDYEPIYSLGSMLGLTETDELLKLIDEVETQGLDAISTGVVLAWATEAYEKGLVTSVETMGLELKWGDGEAYREAVRRIVSQPNEFYSNLAKGVEKAALKHGGMDFALSFGGNEMPGYHTGPAAHLTFLTGARHSHLDSAGYSIDEDNAKTGIRMTPRQIAEALFKEESWRQVLSSLVVCFFARGVYKPETVLECLKTVGFNPDISLEDLSRIGVETLKSKNEFKAREGFSHRDLRIPGRIFETETPLGTLEEEFIGEGIEEFFRLLQ